MSEDERLYGQWRRCGAYEMAYVYNRNGELIDAAFRTPLEKRGLLKRVLDLFRKSL